MKDTQKDKAFEKVIDLLLFNAQKKRQTLLRQYRSYFYNSANNFWLKVMSPSHMKLLPPEL